MARSPILPSSTDMVTPPVSTRVCVVYGVVVTIGVAALLRIVDASSWPVAGTVGAAAGLVTGAYMYFAYDTVSARRRDLSDDV